MPADIPFPEFPLGSIVVSRLPFDEWCDGLYGAVVGYTDSSICVYFPDAPPGRGHEGLSAQRGHYPHRVTSTVGNWFIRPEFLSIIPGIKLTTPREIRKPRNERHGGAKITVCQLNTDT